MFKVIVIDEQPLARLAIRALLQRNNFDWVGEADNGITGLELVRAHGPDLVILDINLPGMNGLELMKQVYDFDRSIDLLVLTANPAIHFYNRCRAARASAFLSKRCSIEDLELAIDSLMKDRASVLDSAGRQIRMKDDFNYETSLIRSLSNRELMTFQLLAVGMKNKEIADYLKISNKTVSTYKVRLLEKLNVFSLVHLLEMARRNGLVS